MNGAASYTPGDMVMYGANGVCIVDEVRREAVLPGAEERLYYVLKPIVGRGMVISVPADCERLTAKLRHVLSRRQIDSMLDSAKRRAIEWIDDRHDRADAFRAILSKGVHEELLLLIRCIYLRRTELTAAGKKLNANDEEVLKNAVRLVREEFAYSLEISPADVGRYIRAALDIEGDGD